MELAPLDDLFEDCQKWHSNYQIDHFVLGSHATPWGTYKQCLRELRTRVVSLRTEVIERAQLAIDVDELESTARAHDEYTSEFDKKRAALDADLKWIQLNEKDYALHHRAREIRRFWAHASVLKAHLGNLSEEDREALERSYWWNHAHRLLALDLYVGRAPSRATLEIIASMGSNERTGLFESLKGSADKPEQLLEVLMRQHGASAIILPQNFDEQCRALESTLTTDEILENIEECLPLLAPT